MITQKRCDECSEMDSVHKGWQRRPNIWLCHRCKKKSHFENIFKNVSPLDFTPKKKRIALTWNESQVLWNQYNALFLDDADKKLRLARLKKVIYSSNRLHYGLRRELKKNFKSEFEKMVRGGK